MEAESRVMAIAVDNEFSMVNVELDRATNLSLSPNTEINLRKHILVWGDGWSNWFTTLLSVGFKNLYFIHDKHSHLSPLLTKFYDIKVMAMQECMNQLDNNAVIYEDSVALILEGKPEHIKLWYGTLLEFYDKRAFESVCMVFTRRCRSFNQFKDFTWTKIRHAADAGGATTSSFQVAYKSRKPWKRIAALPQWTLTELTDVTITGDTTSPPEEKLIFLPIAQRYERRKLPSIFSKTGWVLRQLSMSEILRAWDIPKQLDKTIIENIESDSMDQEAIFRASPSKVSLFVMQQDTRLDEIHLSTTPLYQSIIPGNYNPVSIQESSIDKSVKSDDAAVPISLWNEKLFLKPLKYVSERHDNLLENLRSKFVLRWYRKNIFKSYSRYMKAKHGLKWSQRLILARRGFCRGQDKSELLLDGNVGADAVGRAVNADWWNWNDGSTLLFWRWPEEVRKEARDGSSFPWVLHDKLPNYKIPQRYPRDQLHKDLLIAKVWSPILRRYIEGGFVKSLSGFFCIPKGSSDIRIVYDMTKCGLNAALWSPRFYLPTPDSVFDSIEYQSWMADTDQGKMFLNYFADPHLLQYMGVDVTEIVKGSELDTGKGRIWMRWNRWPMGVRQSP